MDLRPLADADVLALEGVEYRRPRSKPPTLARILGEARDARPVSDLVGAWLRGEPVPGVRHPRKTLRRLLNN